ncbi:MAG: hypothetical protein WC727_12470 [Ignavibacteriaceae bacterium]|jgi:hypothetical protein
MKRKQNKQNVIEVKYEELEQYDTEWDDKIMEEKESLYAHHIGAFLIWFSKLENRLDIELSNLINDRSHDEGYIILKDLDMSGKIELFYNLAFPRAYLTKKSKSRRNKLFRLSSIRKKLEDLSTLRNKIAHAKWNTLDKDGYVRVDTKTKKEDGFIKFRKLKITPALMRKSMEEIPTLIEKLVMFTDRILLS